MESTTTKAPLVRIEGLSKTFPGQRALNGVSFEIGHDEIHALVGENGSGKSTLIKVLSGFHHPDPGSRIAIDGEPFAEGSAADAWRHGLRFVHQHLGLIGELTAAENVGLASGFATIAPGRIAWSRQRRHTQELLARIGVEFDVDRPVAKLRAVERSALAIARAIDDSHGAISLLVLDEPSAALPPAECESLFRVVREVVAKGVSVLYVSHRLEEILNLASRVTVLRDGSYQGTFDAATLDRGRLAELIVGKEVEARPPQVGEATSAEPVLSVRGLRCDPLAGAAFDVLPGEVLGVAGLSGSGREVLAAAICGAVAAEMELTIAGQAVEEEMDPLLAERHGLALVLPNRHADAAIPNFTIGENITLGRLGEFAGRAGRVSKRREREAVLEWIERLDIRPADPDRLYGLLSGGNQQKVLLAKWFGIDPKVVFMDDPTSGVDIGARHAIYDVIRTYADAGIAFVVCSSDMEDFVGVCDRVIGLVEGHVVTELDRDHIQESELLRAISDVGTTADAA